MSVSRALVRVLVGSFLLAACLPMLFFAIGGGSGGFIRDRHQAQTHNEYYKYGEELSFEQYLLRAQEQIAAVHPQAGKVVDADSQLTVLDLIKPIELQSEGFDSCEAKDRRGIMMVHGLTDSPFLLRDIAYRLQGHSCLLLRSLLLPGHGTIPGDLVDVSYQDWQSLVDYGASKMWEAGVDHYFIVGYSTGAVLALDYLARTTNRSENDAMLKGIILLSPAVELDNPLINLVNLVTPLRNLMPHFAWWQLEDDADVFKYESFPINAAKQIDGLVKEMSQGIERSGVPIPMLMIVSEDDTTVDSFAAVDFFDRHGNEQSQLITYQRGAANSCIKEERYCFRRSSFPEQQMISFSHIALPVSPENFHYGENASYYYCSHYHNDHDKKDRCMNGERGSIPFAETNYDPTVIVRRSTYNPDFSFMLEKIHAFISP